MPEATKPQTFFSAAFSPTSGVLTQSVFGSPVEAVIEPPKVEEEEQQEEARVTQATNPAFEAKSHLDVVVAAQTKSEEELIESVLSLELVQTFCKVSNVKTLKPITSAIESNANDYQRHWRQLLRYELFCKLVEPATDFTPPYHPLPAHPRSPGKRGEYGQGTKLSLTFVPEINSLYVELTVIYDSLTHL